MALSRQFSAHELAGELALEMTEGTAGGGSDGNSTSLYTARSMVWGRWVTASMPPRSLSIAANCRLHGIELPNGRMMEAMDGNLVVATLAPDVVVAEADASPLEPYNGETALQILGDQIKFELLCTRDPYAVVGVKSAFAREPDLVAGGAANTSAGFQLVRNLADLPALNLLDPAFHSQLREMLSDSLSLAIKH